MADGAWRYAEYCKATGKIGTEYVMQASTFFGPDQHFLQDWRLPLSKAQISQNSNIAASQDWLEESTRAAQ